MNPLSESGYFSVWDGWGEELPQTSWLEQNSGESLPSRSLVGVVDSESAWLEQNPGESLLSLSSGSVVNYESAFEDVPPQPQVLPSPKVSRTIDKKRRVSRGEVKTCSQAVQVDLVPSNLEEKLERVTRDFNQLRATNYDHAVKLAENNKALKQENEGLKRGFQVVLTLLNQMSVSKEMDYSLYDLFRVARLYREGSSIEAEVELAKVANATFIKENRELKAQVDKLNAEVKVMKEGFKKITASKGEQVDDLVELLSGDRAQDIQSIMQLKIELFQLRERMKKMSQPLFPPLPPSMLNPSNLFGFGSVPTEHR